MIHMKFHVLFSLKNNKNSLLSGAMDPGPEVIKKFLMLNSAEHEIFHANKS